MIRHIMALETLAAICKYGLLASTLFTFHDHACDNEKLHLRCPHGTSLIIKWAQYGRVKSSQMQCHPLSLSQSAQIFHRRRRKASISDTTQVYNETIGCLASTSLEVVVNLCQGKQQCQVKASSQVFGEDPCPSNQLEVGYQCQPDEYETVIGCKGSKIEISCASTKRIAVHSAIYGFSSPGVDDCPRTNSFENDCFAPCSAQVVARLCHGRRSCRISVGPDAFGHPCRSGTNEYLKIFHSCVSRRILKDSIRGEDFPYSLCGDDDVASFTLPKNTTEIPWPELDYISPTSLVSPSLLPASGGGKMLDTDGRLIGDWASTWKYINDFMYIVTFSVAFNSKRCVRDFEDCYNYERFKLYLVIAIFAGIILVLLVIILKLSLVMCRLRNRQRTLVLAVEPTSPLPTEIDISPGGDVTDMVERSIDMPTPELARRTIRRTISGGDISGGLPLRNNSPEYVHVESPRESPTLGRAPPIDQSSPWVRTQSSPEAVQVASPTFSPVWVRVDSPDSSPVLSSPRAPPSSPILAQVPLKESVSARSLPVAPLGRFLSRSYTNPYRQDLTFVERQLPSSSNRLRLQFK